MTPEQRLEEKFWSRVDKSGECWIWLGAKDKRGYGKTWTGTKTINASRMVLLFKNPDLPKNIYACHHCDNPSCVRPEHIYAGTNKQNIQDSIDRGRWTQRRALQKYCAKGHERTADNIFITTKYGREIRNCKICYTKRQKARYE